MLQLKKGIKLESLRQPFKQSLQTASEIGAEGIEVNGRTELRPSELSQTGIRHLRKMLSDLNLKVAAVHFPTRRGYDDPNDLDRRIDATKAALTLAYQLGCNVVTNRMGTLAQDSDSERRATLTEALLDLGRFSHKAGAWLAVQAGNEEASELKNLLDSLPTMAVGVDFDPARMIINGFPVTEAMNVLGAHVMHFRARDAVHDLNLGRGLEVQLGRGSVDLPALLATLEENHYDGFFTIERDAEADAILHCAQAVEYLDQLFQ